MSIVLILYLVDICNGLSVLCTIIDIILVGGFALCLYALIDTVKYDADDEFNQLKKWVIGFLISTVLMSLILVLIPSKTTLLTYAGINISTELKTEIQSSETYQKVLKVLNKELDNYIAKQEKENN